MERPDTTRRIYYIVDMWTATSIRVQQIQGKELKSLATYWWDRRPKLDEWMKDWLKKQHPAPDYSVQHPKSRAFILRLYICENYAKNRLLLTAKKKTSCFCMLFLQNHIFVCSRLLWAASCGSAKILQFPQKRLLVSDSIVVHSCCLREEF